MKNMQKPNPKRAFQNWFLHYIFAQQFWVDDFEGHFGVIMTVVTQNFTQNCNKFLIRLWALGAVYFFLKVGSRKL
jgi:hypothetical protein